MSIITKSELRKSGYIFSFMIFLIFVLLPLIIHSKMNMPPLILGICIVFISFSKPTILRKPYLFWLSLGNFLGEFNSKIILGLFFYLFITPFSLLRNILKFLIFKKYNEKSFYKINKNNSKFEDQF